MKPRDRRSIQASGLGSYSHALRILLPAGAVTLEWGRKAYGIKALDAGAAEHVSK
jgi:hypothetical protein